MIRIIIADDHPLIRMGLQLTLSQAPDMEIVAEADNGQDALRCCEELSPDILLLDISMPGPSTVCLVENLLNQCSQTKILILTAHDDEIYVRNLIAQGVAGYVLKDEVPDTLIRAIRSVIEGDTWFSKRVVDILSSPSLMNEKNLTEREIEVFNLLVRGKSNCQIAAELEIAEGTVKNHIMNIYKKLEVHSRAEAISLLFH